MRGVSISLLVAGFALFAPIEGVFAQETGTTDTTAPPASRGPVFSLPPGNTPEPAQPDIQGPRDPNAPVRQPQRRPTPTPARQQAPPPATQSAEPEQTRPETAPRPVTAQPTGRPAATPQADRDSTPTGAVPQTVDDSAPVAMAPDIEPDANPVREVPPPFVSSSEAPGESGGFPWWIAAILGFFVVAAIFVLRRWRRAIAMPTPMEDRPAPKPVARPQPTVRPREPRKPPPAAPILPEVRKALPPAPPPTPYPLTAPVLRAMVPVQKAKTPPAAPTAPNRLEIEFQPLTAKLTPSGLAVSYRLFVGCVSVEPITDISMSLSLRTADRGMAKSPHREGSPELYLAALSRGKSQQHLGELRLDRTLFTPVPLGGKPMLVPVIDLKGQYTDADGTVHEKHLAILVGQEHTPQKAQLAPFPLDREEVAFTNIGCRPIDIPDLDDVAA